MFTLSASRPLAGLVVVVAATLLAAAPVLAQSAPALAPLLDSRATAGQSGQPPQPGYNPGESLRDLVNPVVADIDGNPITLAEIGDAIRALPDAMRNMPFEDLYPAMLDRMIQERALVMQARRERLDADPVVKRHMRESADRTLENELLNRLLDKTATDDVLLARYRKEFDGKLGPEEVHARVILVPTEEQARKLIKELADGADFAALASRDSVDSTRQSGGDLGFLRQDQLSPEVGGAAFVMEPGQVSPNPVRGGRGWFVIKVEARRRVAPPSFAEVRERLRHEVLQEGVARAARDAVAKAEVHKFNINGSPMGGSAGDQGDSGR